MIIPDTSGTRLVPTEAERRLRELLVTEQFAGILMPGSKI